MYSPSDGARLDRLLFNEVDLLTVEPKLFSPPVADYGVYESRPVYGYDDCFPSVSECPYPGMDWIVPDHGEVCWLPWEVVEKESGLEFWVKSRELPLTLKRKLVFSKNKLTWHFEVANTGNKTLPFQHIIHPLMPLNEVVGLQVPGFKAVFDDINELNLNLNTPIELEKYLLEQPKGTANMLFLQNIKEGRLKLKFKTGITLEVQFSKALFPSIGIWWNNNGYPNEYGLRRNECAFEPVSGSNSSLEDAYKESSCLSLPPGKKLNWNIEWKINHS